MASSGGSVQSDWQREQPFRLLDLPQEVQDRIYEKYFEDAPAVIPSYDKRVTNLNIELACRKVQQDAMRARDKLWPRVVEITPAQLCALKNVDVPSPGQQWLCHRIEGVRVGFVGNFESEEIPLNLQILRSHCPKLRQFILVSHSYYDERCPDFYNHFSNAVDLIGFLSTTISNSMDAFLLMRLGLANFLELLDRQYEQQHWIELYSLLVFPFTFETVFRAIKYHLKGYKLKVLEKWIGATNDDLEKNLQKEGFTFPEELLDYLVSRDSATLEQLTWL